MAESRHNNSTKDVLTVGHQIVSANKDVPGFFSWIWLQRPACALTGRVLLLRSHNAAD